MAKFDIFRAVCHKTKISISTPSSDSRRRIDTFLSSRKGIGDLMVGLSPAATTTFDPYFLHIAVIAGPKNFNDYVGPRLGFPEGSPCLSAPLPQDLVSLPTRSHRMMLSDDVGLQIVLTCLPGSLNVPATFTGVGDQ